MEGAPTVGQRFATYREGRDRYDNTSPDKNVQYVVNFEAEGAPPFNVFTPVTVASWVAICQWCRSGFIDPNEQWADTSCGNYPFLPGVARICSCGRLAAAGPTD